MGFSNEWEEMYKTGEHNSVWPWSDLVSMFHHYFKGERSELKVLELGCGAGANIPFFVSLGIPYFGIEGSGTQVEKLRGRYAGNSNVSIIQGDFSKGMPFDGEFDLIIDRGSVTHNSTEGIKDTLQVVNRALNAGGYYFGIDWFSVNYDVFSDESLQYEQIDSNTKVFHTGDLADLGNVHFSDEKHIRSLFEKYEGMKIIECREKIETWTIPNHKRLARWCFVARKGDR